MAGNANSGRRRKPTAMLKLFGRFEKSRHGKRIDEQFKGGKPEKLVGMSNAGRRVWDLVIANTPPEVLSPIDAMMLAGTAEWFALYWSTHRAIQKAGECDPASLAAAQTAWRNFVAGAMHFGMSPTTRAKFEKAGAAGVDDLEQFMNQV